MRKFAGLLSLALWCLAGRGESVRDHAVEVWASVQESPPQITLHWLDDGDGTSYHLFRKAKDSSSWTDLGFLDANVVSYIDTNVAIGIGYEYGLTKPGVSGYPYSGYIYAGIRAPLTDQRGKIILVTDNTYSAALSNELARLQQDLVGDGWTVLRHDVSRSDTPPNVKALIKTDYLADSNNCQALFLFGHVPIPYSGDYSADDHEDHTGAWEADCYYGDFDGLWTDTTVSDVSATRVGMHNVPGDGKFDQSMIPSTIRLQIGRVDLADLPYFAPSTELDLLRAYLTKDHLYRTGAITAQRRALFFDELGPSGGKAYGATGWRNAAPLLGPSSVTELGVFQFFPTLSNQDYLWSYIFGGGDKNYTDVYDVGNTLDFVNTSCKTVFTVIFASYQGDWDVTNSFSRAALGSGNTLTVSWAGMPHWFYHHMGLGETIGYSTRLTQNNTGLYVPADFGHRVHISLLGDPTLRMQIVQPPTSLTAKTNGFSINLQWNTSPDSSLLGYHIYRATNSSGLFARITSAPVNSTNFQDSPSSGNYTYMVRAIKLESGFSGTFSNASTGIFASASITNPATPVAVSQPHWNGTQISFLCSGQPGQKFAVDYSSNFVSWIAIATNTLSSNSLTFTDSRASSREFYRTRLTP